MRKILASALALALIAGACSSSGSESAPATGTPGVDGAVDLDGDDVRLLSKLVPFASCDALLEHIKSEATERVGPYGLDYFGYGPWVEDEVFFTDEAEAEDAAGEFAIEQSANSDTASAQNELATGTGGDDAGEGGEGGDFTGTNVQEAGVDEPDIVKTDGDRIIAISDNTLSYVDVSSGDATLTDQLTISEGWAHELFFDGDRALLFTNGGSWGYPLPYGRFETSTVSDVADAEAQFADEPLPVEPGWYGPAASIFEIDLSDPTNLEISSSLRIQGEYLSARRVGDTVRLALTSPPTELPWVYPSGPSGEDRAEETNRELIAETTIEDWIPQFELSANGESTSGPLLDCERLHRPPTFSGFDMVSVLSFELDEGLDNGTGAGVLASGRTVYASTDRFYVATTEWADFGVLESDVFASWEESYTTNVHAFSITPDEPADYVASGTVPGSLLNQFSLDEHDGYLRAITTEGTPWSERNQSESLLTVLAEEGDEMVQVGQVGGLGKGETLYAARLLDDVGFAVTFRQIDPFYVLDLSDPTNPEVTGELKIPGFSTYLHPIGDDLVLGIGQDATEEGRTLGVKVSLFDVGDPTDPRELATWTKGDANSPAEHDHRAFQYLADERIAILPVQDWLGEFNGAVLLKIGDETIVEVGAVSHISPADEPASDCDVVDPETFPEDTELFWIAQEGGRVQFCDENDNGGYGTWYCEPWPLEELRAWGPDDEIDEVIAELVDGEPGPEDRIEMCWPDDTNWREQIQRSLVIGDDLWTMSWSQLQANGLDDLEERHVIEF